MNTTHLVKANKGSTKLCIALFKGKNPPWMNLAEETFGFQGIGFSPVFSLLKPTFSLRLRRPLLSWLLPSKAECSPTDAF
jgi:hypothetical protein